MKKLCLLLISFSVYSGICYAQVCTPTVAALKGKYYGDCKKGKADGRGTAQGTDSYTGDFKKGVPDGKGKYTWKNGDWYDGEWKSGLFDGYGTLSKADKERQDSITVTKGYWKKGKYIGEKLPYYVQSVTANISKVKITRLDSTGSQITITTETLQGGSAALGYTTNSKLISVDNLEGQYQQKTDYGSTNKTTSKYGLSGLKFPYKGILSFETQGTLMKHIDTITFGINEKGNWLIEVTISN